MSRIECPSEAWDRCVKDEEDANKEKGAVEDIAEWLGVPGAKMPTIKKRLYRDTECGVGIEIKDMGVYLTTIVEGSCAEFEEVLEIPTTEHEFRAAIQCLEDAVNEWVCEEGDAFERHNEWLRSPWENGY